MLMQRSVENHFQPIASLETGEILGYEALRQHDRHSPMSSPVDRTLLATECRLTGRLHHLYRMVAVEEASRLVGDARLFLRLSPEEIGTEGLTETLGGLHHIASNGRGIVVEIPDSTVCDTPHFLGLLSRLRERQISIAYDGFAFGPAQVKEQKRHPPDFLKLAPSLVRGIDRSRDRQRQVRSVVRASRKIGCEVIATGVHSSSEAETCQKLGCQYAQGRHCGGPQSIHSVLGASQNSANGR
jgi:EAL domain-containing protein (putative c-di-GMP-specific phosphodiesterase class I)